MTLELFLVGEGDRMDDEIEAAPILLQVAEDGVHAALVFDVAGQHEGRADAFGQRPYPFAERLALVGKGHFGAVPVEDVGDPPGDRTIVGDAHDQALLAGHERAFGRQLDVVGLVF